MTAHKCDRCGKFFDKIEYFKNFTITGNFVVNLMYKTGNGTRFNIDLCPECVKNFKSWFNEFEIGTPEETESEESNA